MAERKRHYSEKGGHRARGEFARRFRQIEEQFPGLFFRWAPQAIPIDTWTLKRNMRRIPRDGR